MLIHRVHCSVAEANAGTAAGRAPPRGAGLRAGQRCRATVTAPAPYVAPCPLPHQPRLSYVGVALAASADGISSDLPSWCAHVQDRCLVAPPVSRPDAEFLAQGLEFVYGREGIKVTELNDLFEKVNFPRRDAERLKLALDNTHRLVWVRSTKQSRFARLGQVVGIARAISDGALYATIWDVCVLPAWQRSGLGRAMIERLLAGLVEEDGITCISLYAEPQVVGLYKKLGFIADPEGIKGLSFQRKKRSGSSGSVSLRQSVYA